MAYFYFDSNEHVVTTHSEDVYIVANVGDYHDYNGQTNAVSFGGFYLKGGLVFTLGGNYRTLTQDTDIFNIHQTVTKTFQEKNYAAVHFAGNGEFVIASATGAPDAAKHDDRNIKIHAYNYLSNHYSFSSPAAWKDPVRLAGNGGNANFNNHEAPLASEISFNSRYKTSGQVADVSGVHAENGILTIGSHFNGTITVDGYHDSHGMLDSSRNAVLNTVTDTHSVASGLRGDTNIKINGNFYGNLEITQRTHLQTAGKTLTGNLSAAYGVWSGSKVEQKNVWSGGIFTAADKNYFDATIACDAKGAQVQANGNLSNNTIESIGIKADNIYINFLDYKYNTEHKSSTPILEEDTTATTKFNEFTITSSGVTEKITKTTVNTAQIVEPDPPHYLLELPEELQQITRDGETIWLHENGNPVAIGIVETYSVQDGKIVNTGGTPTKFVKIDNSSKQYTGKCGQFINDLNVVQSQPDKTPMAKWEFSRSGMTPFYSYKDTELTANNPTIGIAGNINYTDLTWTRSSQMTAGKFIVSIAGHGSMVIDYNDPNLKYDAATKTYTYRLSDAYQGCDVTNYYEIQGDISTVSGSGTSEGTTISFVSTSYAASFEINYDLISHSSTGKFQDELNKIADDSKFIRNTPIPLPGGLWLHEYTSTNPVFKLFVEQSDHVLIHSQVVNNIMKTDGDVANSNSNTMTNNTIQAIGIEAAETNEIRNFTEGSIIEVKAEKNRMEAGVTHSGSSAGNEISAVGIEGKNIQLHDFNGKINVVATDNSITAVLDTKSTMTFAGLYATENINVSKNLYGTIEVIAGRNSVNSADSISTRGDVTSSTGHTDGIFTKNMNVDGFIETDISVKSTGTSTSIISGIYVTETLNAKGFSGTITVDCNYLSEIFGIYAGKFDSEIGYYYETYNVGTGRLTFTRDVFNVDGRIYVSGYKTVALATAAEANLYINGIIVSAEEYYLDAEGKSTGGIISNLNYAVKSDYGHNVSSGFNDDFVILGENAHVVGVIDLGGGKNTLIFNSNAYYYGYVAHDVAGTNIIYSLDGAAKANEAVHYAFEDCDATLSSGTTITIDCNNIKIGDTYTLIDYDNNLTKTDEFGNKYDIVDERYKNAEISLTYQGQVTTYKLTYDEITGSYDNGWKSFIGADNKKFYVKVEYDQTTNSLSVSSQVGTTTNPDDVVALSQNITTVSITTTLDKNGKEIETLSFNGPTNAKLENTFSAAIKAQNNNSTPDYVTYDRDTDSRTATANSTIYWICDTAGYGKSAYEVEYTVVDALGNVVSSATLRMTTIDPLNNTISGAVTLNGYTQPAYGKVLFVNDAGKTQEQMLKENPNSTTPFAGKYYIMSYDINNIPDGCTVNYKVRDFIDEGNVVNDWTSGSVNTQKQDFSATITPIDKNAMAAVDPDLKVTQLTHNEVLLTWAAPNSNYAIDNYNVQYFITNANLDNNQAKRKLIFDAYENAKNNPAVKKNEWFTLEVDENGNPSLQIRFVETSHTKHEVQIREIIGGAEYDAQGNLLSEYIDYTFVDKNVSSTKLLITAGINNEHVYWRINAEACDSKNTMTGWTEGTPFKIDTNNAPIVKPEVPEDPVDPDEITKAPTGKFGNIEAPVITPELQDKLDENGVPIVDEYGNVEQEFLSADITFSWTDSFVANSKDASLYYIFQVSDSQHFDSERTETILLLPSSLDSDTISKVYAAVAEKYDNLKILNSVTSWRSASGSNYTTSVTFDNSHPTVPVGMFANNPNTYYQIKAVDTYGNEAEYCNVQAFKPVYAVKETYTEVNPETGVLETKERDVYKYITDLAPAKAYDLEIETPEQLDGKNTGKIELKFKADHKTMGIDKIAITINGKNVAGTKLATDVITIEAAVIEEQVENSNMTEFTKELFDIITVDGLNYSNGYLVDGTYTVSVTTYNSKGSSSTSKSYSFVQDTTRPVIQTTSTGSTDKTTISASFAKQDPSVKEITVTVNWPIAEDTNDIVGYYLWYKAEGTSEWQEARINNETLIKTNSCKLTLTNGQSYDFKVVAKDEYNNLSTPVEVNGIDIVYRDVDDDYVTPDDFTDYEPFSIVNEVIGGDDTVDKIHVSTNNAMLPDAPGQMLITVSNLQRISGSGKSIIIDVYEDKGGDVKVKSYSFSISSDAKTYDGKTYKYLVPVSGNQYTFEVRSSNKKSVFKYDFNYEFDFFNVDNGNDVSYGLDPIYEVDFDTEFSSTAMPEDYNGVLKHIYTSLSGANGSPMFAGYGDKTNFNKIHIGTDGKYSINLSKNASSADSLATLKLTIYKAVPGSTSLKAVKSMTVSGKKLEGAIKDLELTAGDYIIQVTAPSAAKGANINYTVNISTQTDKYYSGADNSDDNFADAAADTYAFGDNRTLIFGTAVETGVEGEFGYLSEFIGKNDLSDFKKITVDESGLYKFTVQKTAYLSAEKEKQIAYGSDGTLTMNIYILEEGKTSLTKVDTVTVKKNKLSNVLETYLEKGEYYIEVAADKKSALYYGVTLEKAPIIINDLNYTPQGNFSIADNVVYSEVIDKNGRYHLNKVSAPNQSAQIAYKYAGFGEENNFYKVTLAHTGDYTFYVNYLNDEEKEESFSGDFSSLKAVIYQANEDGNGFNVVKTINLSKNKQSAFAVLNGLSAGEYFIGISATDAAKGKYAVYNIAIEAENIIPSSSAIINANSNFAEAAAYNIGSSVSGKLSVDDSARYYEFNTADVAGKFNFSFLDGCDYSVYVLKDGDVNLTEVKLESSSAYFEDNTRVFVGVNTNDMTFGSINYQFAVSADATLAKNVSAYTADSIPGALSDAKTITLGRNVFNSATGLVYDAISESYSSWAGFGDTESWRKLVLDDAGSFNLTLEKFNDVASTELTVTVYKFVNNGKDLKAVGTFSVGAANNKFMKNFTFDKGEYFIQVKASDKGNTEFTLTIDGDTKKDPNCYIVNADNTDDTAVTGKTFSAAGGSTGAEWVGYTDEYDYFNVEVSATGYYDFTLKNSDAVQVTLYAVNPANNKLITVGTYKNSSSIGENNIFSCLLNSNTHYVAMVKSTNAKKGGYCDYTLSAAENSANFAISFNVDESEVGKYVFFDNAFDVDSFKIEKFNPATGKTSAVKLTSDNVINLSAGDYILTSNDSDLLKYAVTLDEAEKTVTLA